MESSDDLQEESDELHADVVDENVGTETLIEVGGEDFFEVGLESGFVVVVVCFEEFGL